MKLFKRKMGKKQKAALNALADGIECGAKLRPQKFGSLLGYNDEGDLGSCALGAALECKLVERGETVEEYEIRNAMHADILKLYGLENRVTILAPNLDRKSVETDPTYGVPLDTVIWRLNDWLTWPREKIAQFLRELE